jgi:predicted DNA-binding ribbon-helix-helix protein
MKSPVVKRSIVLAGHKTSVSLEEPFWTSMKQISKERDVALFKLIGQIDGSRQQGNLSSAIRLFVLDHYKSRDAPRWLVQAGHWAVGTHSGQAGAAESFRR